MWWKLQNMQMDRRDKSGQKWHFRVWYDTIRGIDTQRIYFWSDSKHEMGVVEIAGKRFVHPRHVKSLIAKLVSDPAYRARFHREFLLPVEKHYDVEAP
jgi:hypothetical protein